MQQKSKNLSEYHEIRKKIKEVYTNIQNLDVKLPSTFKQHDSYYSGTLPTLKKHLKYLESLYTKYNHDIPIRMNRIEILYNKLAEYGQPLLEQL